MTDRQQRVFAALADPTRRQIVESLSAGGSTTATELATRLPITRQGVAKHLGILADAGLVETQRQGRETIYTLVPEPLQDTVDWVEAIHATWDKRLSALRDYLAGSDAPDTQA
jgi:DNA-binding transcriptional ArsR family regulator